jgi:hypothetical protein
MLLLCVRVRATGGRPSGLVIVVAHPSISISNGISPEWIAKEYYLLKIEKAIIFNEGLESALSDSQ